MPGKFWGRIISYLEYSTKIIIKQSRVKPFSEMQNLKTIYLPSSLSQETTGEWYKLTLVKPGGQDGGSNRGEKERELTRWWWDQLGDPHWSRDRRLQEGGLQEENRVTDLIIWCVQWHWKEFTSSIRIWGYIIDRYRKNKMYNDWNFSYAHCKSMVSADSNKVLI